MRFSDSPRAGKKAPLKRNTDADYYVSNAPVSVSVEEELLAQDIRKEALKRRREHFCKYLMKAIQILLVLLCAYFIFLIYGVVNTEYVYDKQGYAVPLVLSVNEIRELDEFNTMQTQYLQARVLYEKVLVLDYRIAMGQEDPLLIAPEYEKLLEGVSSLSVQIGALTVPAQYTQPMDMLLSWVQNDIALYCQFISKALTQNSMADMNNALVEKDLMYTNFRQITQVVATLGSKVPNADIADISAWSPENYISQFTGE